MQFTKKKTTLFMVLATTSNLILGGLTAYAQDTGNQQAVLNILSFYDFAMPLTLDLPTIFSQENQDVIVYKAFSPSDDAENIKVFDLRSNEGFSVYLTVTDFVSASGSIPYNNIGIVTLANAENPDTVDTPGPGEAPNNPPDTDSGTVFAPLDCDWDFIESFSDACGVYFQNFSGSGVDSDAQTIIDGVTTTTGGRTGEYWVALGLRLLIPAGTPADDYQSEFTFSIVPEVT